MKKKVMLASLLAIGLAADDAVDYRVVEKILAAVFIYFIYLPKTAGAILLLACSNEHDSLFFCHCGLPLNQFVQNICLFYVYAQVK